MFFIRIVMNKYSSCTELLNTLLLSFQLLFQHKVGFYGIIFNPKAPTECVIEQIKLAQPIVVSYSYFQWVSWLMSYTLYNRVLTTT